MLGKERRVAKSGKASGSRNIIKETDYRCYQMTFVEAAVCIGKALLLTAAVAWLFYQSLVGMLALLVIGPMFWITEKKSKKQIRQEELRNHFKESIRLVSASMNAGYSVENAFREAEKELTVLIGKKADMCRELHRMNQQICLNVSIESLLKSLAERSGVEEIGSFGQVFGYAKRSGSDFPRILRDTAERIAEKAELERELQTLIAEKRLEQRIMTMVPLGILLFINISSPDFLQVLYEGVFGKVIMSGCLLAYGGAYVLSQKIVNIRI